MITDNAPYFVTLPNRGLIHIEGKDRRDFLQGLISNDINKLAPDSALYACLLTPQGKFLHDFFIHDGGDFLLLDCEGGARAADLYKRLTMYRLRADVQLSFEEEHTVYALFGNDSFGLPDPRHTKMGRRCFQKPDTISEKPFTLWDQRRIALTIPDGSRDMIAERSTVLECNLDHFNAIDWDKGCYMGQELTARMHYRGLAKKHLYTVQCNETLPHAFTPLDNGGEMRSSSGEIGLALLKDNEAEKLKNDNGEIRILGL